LQASDAFAVDEVRLALGSGAVMQEQEQEQEQEVYIGNAASLFDDNGDIANEATREFLEKFLQVFSQWIERNITK
jgi:hypothetical protein